MNPYGAGPPLQNRHVVLLDKPLRTFCIVKGQKHRKNDKEEMKTRKKRNLCLLALLQLIKKKIILIIKHGKLRVVCECVRT